MLFDDFNYMSLDLQSNFSNSAFIFNNKKDKTQKIISNILKDINAFTINSKGKVDIKNEDYGDLSIRSDLDKKLASAFKSELKKQTNIYKVKLKNKIRDEVKSSLGNIDDKTLDSIENSIKNYNGDISSYESKIKKYFSKKTLQETFEKKIKNKAKEKEKEKIKDKLEDKLKSLF